MKEAQLETCLPAEAKRRRETQSAKRIEQRAKRKSQAQPET